MDQKDYWDQAADAKEFSTEIKMDFFRRYAPLEASVLEVGCGYGRVLAGLWAAGYKNLIGVDFSGRMIQRGRQNHRQLDLRIMTKQKLDFADQTFDALLLIAVLTCIPDDEDQANLLRECRRVLKPGGLLVVNDFLLNNDQRNLERYQAYPEPAPYGVFALPDGARLRHHDPAWVAESLAAFQQLHYEEVSHRTMNGHQSRGYHYFGRRRA